MDTPAPKIEVGDRVAHQGREGYVRHVYPTGICWVDFVVRGGVSAPFTELTLIEKARPEPKPPQAGKSNRQS